MIPHTFKKRGVSLLVAASACCSGIVHAQLEEVIVTAQKKGAIAAGCPHFGFCHEW